MRCRHTDYPDTIVYSLRPHRWRKLDNDACLLTRRRIRSDRRGCRRPIEDEGHLQTSTDSSLRFTDRSSWIALSWSSVQSDLTSPDFRKLSLASHLSIEHPRGYLGYLEHYEHAGSAEWNNGWRCLHNIGSTPHRRPHYGPRAKLRLPIRLPSLRGTGLLLLQQVPFHSLRGKRWTTVSGCRPRRTSHTREDRDSEYCSHVS